MTTATAIQGNATLEEVIRTVTEGNRDAVAVTTLLIGELGVVGARRMMMDMAQMNIRGARLWLGYKEHCMEDIDRFIACIRDNDPKLVERVNRPGNRRRLGFKELANVR